MNARSLRTNFAINVAGAIVPLVVSLVTMPINIHYLGNARYGVISIVWVFLGYFGFLDLGLSRAAANSLARLRDGSQSERARVIVTTIALNLSMGIIGGLSIYALGSYILQYLLHLPESLKVEVAQSFPWIAALFPLALVSGVGIGALEAREQFVKVNILQVAGTVFGQTIPVILAVMISPSLALIIPATAAIRAMSSMAILSCVYMNERPLSVSHFELNEVRRLLSYGGWVSISSFINPLLTTLDQFIIGSVSGVASIPFYSIPMNFALRTQIFAAALSRSLFPRISQLKRAEAHEISSRAFTTVTLGYAIICAPAIFITPLFFKIWVGTEFSALAAPVAQLLFLGAWLNGMAYVPSDLLQSQGRPDVTGRLHVYELIPFIVVLYVLTHEFGVRGAAIAWSSRCAADAILLLRAAGMPWRALDKALIPFLVMIASFFASYFFIFSVSLYLLTLSTIIVFTIALALCGAEDLRKIALNAIYNTLGWKRLRRKNLPGSIN